MPAASCPGVLEQFGPPEYGGHSGPFEHRNHMPHWQFYLGPELRLGRLEDRVRRGSTELNPPLYSIGLDVLCWPFWSLFIRSFHSLFWIILELNRFLRVGMSPLRVICLTLPLGRGETRLGASGTWMTECLCREMCLSSSRAKGWSTGSSSWKSSTSSSGSCELTQLIRCFLRIICVYGRNS